MMEIREARAGQTPASPLPPRTTLHVFAWPLCTRHAVAHLPPVVFPNELLFL